MKNLNNMLLMSIVFVTGGCVLILELTATRVLTPYYGNTIYTISSVLTVILLALSVGYYIGGKVSDRYPSLFLFYSLIFSSGVSVFLLYFLDVFFLSKIAYTISFHTSILLSSLLLFFLPNMLLAMLSPFVIKLEAQGKQNSLGTLAGSVYFYSTAGSIIGSLFSGFLLLPFFGIVQIILGVGVTLVVVGGLGILFGSSGKNNPLTTFSKL